MIDLGRQVRDLDGLSAGSSLAIPVVKPHQRILIGDVKVVAYQREPVRGVEIFGEDGSCFVGAVAVTVPQQRPAIAALYGDCDRKSTRLNSSQSCAYRLPSSA